MNRYEERQEQRRQRYEDRADKAREESRSYDDRARAITQHIPFGQPILVGHHSEKRHRRDLDRVHRYTGKSLEAHNKAEHYEQKAAAVGTGGISSDDPDAVTKLRSQLAALETDRDAMKAANRDYKRDGAAGLESLSGRLKGKALRNFQFWPGGTDRPFPDLSNIGANIRRIKTRIAELEQRAATPAEAETITEGAGFHVVTDPEENRVCFIFTSKPAADVRGLLKRHGFRWSPSRGAWVRMLNNAGTAAAQYVADRINRGEVPPC